MNSEQPGGDGKRKKNKLGEKHILFIVTGFAFGEKPKDIEAAFRKEFPGVELGAQVVYDWDLGNPSIRQRALNGVVGHGKKITPELVAFFDEKRAEFIEHCGRVEPLANREVRIRELGNMYRDALERRNFRACREILDQIAKETGDLYTNKSLIDLGVRKMSDEELLAAIISDTTLAEAARTARGGQAAGHDDPASGA